MPDRPVAADIEQITRRRLVTAAIDASLTELARLLSDTPVSLVVVCTRERTMVGIVTRTDVVRKIAQSPAAVGWLRAADAMTRGVVHCRPDDPLHEVLQTMGKHGLVHMPVVNGGAHPVGVVEARDALRALMEHAADQASFLRDYVMGVGYR
jgi:CBS domain-containing protein